MLLAAESGFDIAVFANYGVLGLMFVFVVGAMLTGNLVAGWVYKQTVAKLEKQLQDERDRCDEERRRHDAEIERERTEKVALRTRMDDQVIPLLTDTGHLLREALRTLGRDGRDTGPRGGGT